MMGWLTLMLAAVLAALLLAFLRFPKGMWMIPATAVTLAATGYAWQGNPGLEGKPAAGRQEKHEVDPGLIAIREAMFGRFGYEDAVFKQADAMIRNGKPEVAAKTLLLATNGAPDNAALWTWFGVTISDSEKGMVSPASRFAFERAMALAPTHPGPPYFFGLALTRGGAYAEARALWVKALALAPEKNPRRDILADQLARLDAFLAAQGGGQALPQAVPEPSPVDEAGNNTTQP